MGSSFFENEDGIGDLFPSSKNGRGFNSDLSVSKLPMDKIGNDASNFY
jgi:hypothetical protein